MQLRGRMGTKMQRVWAHSGLAEVSERYKCPPPPPLPPWRGKSASVVSPYPTLQAQSEGGHRERERERRGETGRVAGPLLDKLNSTAVAAHVRLAAWRRNKSLSVANCNYTPATDH